MYPGDSLLAGVAALVEFGGVKSQLVGDDLVVRVDANASFEGMSRDGREASKAHRKR